MRSQKGITLIALVITIIVMLILVAVTITMAVNGGLFGYAKEAGTKTNAATEAEQTLANGTASVNLTDGTTLNGNINDIVNHYIVTTPASPAN